MFTVTFFSYKGGVGRTLALVNTAYTLATRNNGSKVVILDFDLEAPGIDMIPPFKPERFPEKGGIVEYISMYSENDSPDPEHLPTLSPYSYTPKGISNVTVIPAGKKDRNYQICMSGLSWESLYKLKKGYHFFEHLKKQIQAEFSPDYLIIDSRTGLADISGITTHQMADLVSLVFNLNRQNLEGIKRSYDSIIAAPKPIPIKTLLIASPVPKTLVADTAVLEERLKEAAESMPAALNAGIKHKSDQVIIIPYTLQLAFDDLTFVKDYPDYTISKAYREISEMVIKNNPEEIAYLLARALNFQKKNLFDEAKEEFLNVIAKQPNAAEGYFHYGDFLSKMGKLDEASQQLAKACELEKSNPDYFTALGSAYGRLDRKKDALETFKLAEKLTKRNESILQNIANLYYKLEDHSNYLEYIKKLNPIDLFQTKYSNMEPEAGFGKLEADFIKADLSYPDDFDLQNFWNLIKVFPDLNFREKGAIVQAILEKRLPYSQIKQLETVFKKS